MAIQLEPWKDVQQQEFPDEVKAAVFQNIQDEIAGSLPHVLEQLPKQPTVQGMDSPHQMGDHVCYDMLTRGPHYLMTAHFTSIAPNAPVRGCTATSARPPCSAWAARAGSGTTASPTSSRRST